jgi:hypothetical protein
MRLELEPSFLRLEPSFLRLEPSFLLNLKLLNLRREPQQA